MAKELYSNFSYASSGVSKKRSLFDRKSTLKTTFDAGNLNVIYLDQNICPGDTVKIDMSSVVRMSTPIAPVMDNADMDVYFFFIPNRIIWDHFEEYMGENKTSYWAPDVEYTKPQMIYRVSNSDSQFNYIGGFVDQAGLPLNVTGNNALSVSALPIRSYIKVWNDWFRDQNLQSPLVEQTGDSSLDCSSYLPDVSTGGYVTYCAPLKVCKPHDYFTSALPGPLKSNSPVKLPLGSEAPIVGSSSFHDAGYLAFGSSSSLFVPEQPVAFANLNSSPSQNLNGLLPIQSAGTGGVGIDRTNLVADLTNATAATINDLRNAIVLHQYYEALARCGSRYIEQTKEFFGVDSGDARLQRPELIGGRRIPINVSQVLQTAQSSDGTGVGNTGAYSLTGDSSQMLTFSAREHGIILGVACVRTAHTYCQGIEKQWLRKNRLDEYNPLFANIGEMPILNKEIYADGTSHDDEIFGYQAAWSDMRYTVDHCTGYMRPNVPQSLASWNYAENFEACPVLNSSFIQEGKDNVKRTLQLQSGKANQFIADFYFHAYYTRVLPIDSNPGLNRI